MENSIDHDIIKKKLISKEYKFQQKRGRSKVWDTFGLVVDANGAQIANIVGCKNCYAILKYLNCTSNLVKHKCYIKAKNAISQIDGPEPIVSSDIKNQIFEAATEWTVQNCRPFNIIQDSGLRKLFALFASVGAQYSNRVNTDSLIPHPSTISRKVSQLYKSESDIIKEDIFKARSSGYCISSDVWTDNYLKQAYVSCTLHYIKEGEMVSRLLAVKSMKKDPSTGRIHSFNIRISSLYKMNYIFQA